MKKARKIYVLLGVLLIICTAALIISRQEEKKEKIKNSDAVILTIDKESVTALSWEYAETALSFHKEVNWLYDADEAFPVDEEKITALLEPFEEFGASFEIEDVEDISQYGLDEPVCSVHITADEQEYTITLGSYSTMDEERYVSIGDGKVYLVSHDPMKDYEIALHDLIRQDEIPNLTEVTTICFEGTQNYKILYDEESTASYCPEDIYFTDNEPLDTTLVEAYLNTVAGVDLSEYVTYDVTEEELAEYGLTNPELTITADYVAEKEGEASSAETFVLQLGRNQKELEAALAAGDEEALCEVTAYARVGDSPIVYEITLQEYQNLNRNSYQDLRHREILTAPFAWIYQIDIALDNQDYTFSSAEEDGENIWSYMGEKLDITGLENAITAVKAEDEKSFTDEKPSQKAEICFTVFLNNEAYPEVKVELYRYDGQSCLAAVDGKTVALVPRSTVVDLVEAVNSIVLN